MLATCTLILCFEAEIEGSEEYIQMWVGGWVKEQKSARDADLYLPTLFPVLTLTHTLWEEERGRTFHGEKREIARRAARKQ